MSDNSSAQTVIELDLKGLNCPMPILKTKQALMKAQVGDQIRVYATDPHSEVDFKAFIIRTKHHLLENHQQDGVFTFLIEKAE